MRKLIIILAVLVSLFPGIAKAVNISFTGGAWSTTFNYGPCTQRGGGGAVDCADVQTDGVDWSWGLYDLNGQYTQAAAAANNPAGAGGNGLRVWVGDGDNQQSAQVRVAFPSHQTEVWVRWYERYQDNFAWQFLGYSKELYFTTDGPGISVIPEFAGTSYVLIAQGVTDKEYQVSSSFGWNSIMGGAQSDGLFHCYEVHLKMDTNRTNGIGQFWVDGVLRANVTNVDWSNGSTAARAGWTYFEIKTNQNAPLNYVDMAVDFDDMAIYNVAPLGRDAANNPYIGPISTTTPTITNVTGAVATGQTLTVTGTNLLNSLFEISNSATYHGGTYVAQATVSNNGTAATLTCNMGTLTGAGPFYLWATATSQHSLPYNLSGSPAGDLTAPVTTASPAAGAYPSGQTITLSCTDNVGCREDDPIQICWGETCTPSTAYTTPLTIQVGTLRYRSTDTSSNVEAIKSSAYTISGPDITAPTLSNITPYGELAYGTSTALLQAQSSESATCRYSQEDITYSAMTNTFSTTGGTLHSSIISGLYNGGNYTYYLRCRDAASNESASYSAVFNVSTSVPANVLFTESFEDANIEENGFYDTTTHGTIVSGGYSGNCLQWQWASAASQPTNGGAARKQFTPTDTLYVSYYVKFASTWRGSQQAYHPHMLYVMSDLDDAYGGLAYNYLQTYLEFISDVGSPYEIRPGLALQDELNAVSNLGTPPLDLTAVTENRSVNYCNTPVSTGAVGTCYSDPPPTGAYYSANTWMAGTVDVSKNVWHKVEVYLKMNTIVGGIGQSNGVMQQWIDGVKVIDHSDVLYRTGQRPTLKWAQFVLAPYIGDGSPIAQTMWIDELTVASGMDVPGATGRCALNGTTPVIFSGPDSWSVQ